MEETKKKKKRNILFAVGAVLLIVVLTALPFLLEEKQQKEKNTGSILSARAEIGSLRKTLSGTGTLTEQDAEEVSVPDGVKVTEYQVVNGQFVKQGDPVAVVDKVSVMETISAVRELMEETEAEMEEIRSRSEYTYITAPATGRVKAVYAEAGDSVQDVILKHGALAVLSLDGLMAVRFPAGGTVMIGQRVTVTLADGTEAAGRVETLVDGEATVTFSDENGSIDETVTVRDASGQRLGTGSLFVHSAWKAVATRGTVQEVYAQTDRVISIYGTMLVLNGTAAGGNYEELAAAHRDYEDTMADLFRMYQDGVLRAPCDGCVSGVDEDILKLLTADEDSRPTLSFLVNREKTAPLVFLSSDGESPDDSGNTGETGGSGNSGSSESSGENTGNEDDTDIVKYGAITDVDKEKKTINVIWAGTAEKEEVNLNTPYFVDDEPEGEIKTGYYYNILWDDEFKVVHKLESTQIPYTEEPSPTSGGGGFPGGGGMTSGGGMPSGGGMESAAGGTGGGMPSGGSQTAEESASAIETTTILSVTPHETVSVSITVDELDILYVHTGQEAQVTLDALPGQAFHGRITEINTVASNEGGNSKYSALVELERNGFMLGGMNASVNITIEERENVLLIPSEALTEQNAQSVVYTEYDAKTETLSAPAAVETGLSDGLQVQILSGLQEGDTVWYSYCDTLEIQGLPAVAPGGFPNPE